MQELYKKIKPFFIIVETPLHAGSGNDLGIVDMPIQREKHTGFPKIEASGLKGCIRDAFTNSEKEIEILNEKINDHRTTTLSLTFGPDSPDSGEEHAGALAFTDARLLLFPVKSMKSVFAWITCPKVVERFINDFELAEIENDLPRPIKDTAPHDSQLFIKDNKIVLEEYTLEVTKDKNEDDDCSKFANWLSENVIPKGKEYNYWRNKIKQDIVVLNDDDFQDFVNLSTEVITRIKIDNKTGTVKKGALFTEEYLPTESILYSLALTTPIFNNEKGVFKGKGINEEDLVMEYFIQGLPPVLQIGGNSTIGKGIVRTNIYGV